MACGARLENDRSAVNSITEANRGSAQGTKEREGGGDEKAHHWYSDITAAFSLALKVASLTRFLRGEPSVHPTRRTEGSASEASRPSAEDGPRARAPPPASSGHRRFLFRSPSLTSQHGTTDGPPETLLADDQLRYATPTGQQSKKRGMNAGTRASRRGQGSFLLRPVRPSQRQRSSGQSSFPAARSQRRKQNARPKVLHLARNGLRIAAGPVLFQRCLVRRARVRPRTVNAARASLPPIARPCAMSEFGHESRMVIRALHSRILGPGRG